MRHFLKQDAPMSDMVSGIHGLLIKHASHEMTADCTKKCKR